MQSQQQGVFKAVTVVRIFFLVASLATAVAGLCVPLIHLAPDCDVYVTKTSCGGVTTKVADYTCDLARERFRATLALEIICIVALFAVTLCEVAKLVTFNPAFAICASFLICIASIFQLTVWAMNVAYFRGTATYCGGTAPIDFPESSYGPGLSLFISSWCILCASNCCVAKFPPPNESENDLLQNAH